MSSWTQMSVLCSHSQAINMMPRRFHELMNLKTCCLQLEPGNEHAFCSNSCIHEPEDPSSALESGDKQSWVITLRNQFDFLEMWLDRRPQLDKSLGAAFSRKFMSTPTPRPDLDMSLAGHSDSRSLISEHNVLRVHWLVNQDDPTLDNPSCETGAVV